MAKLRAGQLLPWTAQIPYGFRVHPEHPRDPALVRTDPYEAGVVQEVFATYAQGTATLHSLAEALTQRGVPTPTGKRLWAPATVHGILTNPAYIGQAVAQRYQTRTPQQRSSATPRSVPSVGRGSGIRRRAARARSGSWCRSPPSCQRRTAPRRSSAWSTIGWWPAAI